MAGLDLGKTGIEIFFFLFYYYFFFNNFFFTAKEVWTCSYFSAKQFLWILIRYATKYVLGEEQ